MTDGTRANGGRGEGRESLEPPVACTSQARRDTDFLLISLAIGIFWIVGAVNYAHPQAGMFVLLVMGVLTVALTIQNHPLAGWSVLSFVGVIGVVNRADRRAFNGSDVIGVTREAIVVVAHGGNPYAHHFLHTNPAGAPFPYLPGEIGFYAIPHLLVGQIVGADKWAGICIVLLLALLGTTVGPAPAAVRTVLYATFEPAVLRSLDGSNDTGLALLVLLAVVLLEADKRWESRIFFYASAATFAWALAFKEFSWAIYPFVVLYLRASSAAWKRYAAVSVGLALCIVLPFFVTAPAGFAHNIVLGLSYHQRPFGLDVWAAWRAVPGLSELFRFAPILVVVAVLLLSTIFVMRPASSLSLALLQGLAVLFAAFFFARYATSSYYTFACAILAAAISLAAKRSVAIEGSVYSWTAYLRGRSP